MKSANSVLILAVLMTVVSAFAQGTVNFNNNVAFTTPADRYVYLGGLGGELLIGTQFKAQLYAGTDVSNLTPQGAVRSFRTAPNGPGTWSGGTTTINGFTAGQTVMLAVRVWDIGTGATWEQATIKAGSAAFSYTVPAAGSPPPAFYMEGLRAFGNVPEPSSFVLASLGILSIVLARRRK